MRHKSLYIVDEIELLEILKLTECLGLAVSAMIRKKRVTLQDDEKGDVENYKQKLGETLSRRNESFRLEPF